MNRRMFLKSFGAVAALVVAGPLLAKLPPPEIDRLVSQMRDYGVIENQTFYHDRPIVIDVSSLLISNCTFIATRHLTNPLIVGPNANNCAVESCIFREEIFK